jgi:hypothetical protein
MKHHAESQGSEFRCAYCGEVNHTFVDPSQGNTQKYIEDCQVCCRPNELSVSYDQWNKEFIIQSRQAQ